MKVLTGLLHVTLASSFQRFNKLLSAVLDDLNILVSDGQILSFDIFFSKFDVIFVICIQNKILPQLITILFILFNHEA